MKASKIFLLIIGILACFHPALSQKNSFSFMRPIEGVKTQEWYSIPLPDDIFRHLSPGFNDLRIYSITGNDTIEAPYLLKIGADEVTKQVLNLPVINKSRKGNELLFTFELGDTQLVNQLDLQLTEKNYDALVNIEGSHDQKEWFGITSGERIVSIQNDFVQYTYSSVSFPSSKYRFIKIGITSDSLLTFEHASLTYLQTKTGTFKPVSFTQTIHQKDGYTVMHLELKDYVPVSRLSLKATHAIDFYRAISIEALSDSIKTPKGWQKNYRDLYHGHLTSFQPNTFDFTYFTSSELVLTIHNGDNTPVNINHIEVLSPAVEIITHIKPGQNMLFYGNPSLQKPSYDLIYFKEKIPAVPAVASLGKPVPIVSAKAQEQPLFISRWWLWIMLLLLISVLGYFTLKMLNRHPAA